MRISALLALLAACAVLAACGSGSSYGGGSKSDSSSSSNAKSAVVSSADKAKVGSVIVDAQGRTLYRFTAEAQGVPVCTGDCIGTWPPALASSATGAAQARCDGQAPRRRPAPADLRRPPALPLRGRPVQVRRQRRGRGRPVVRGQGRRRREVPARAVLGRQGQLQLLIQTSVMSYIACMRYAGGPAHQIAPPRRRRYAAPARGPHGDDAVRRRDARARGLQPARCALWPTRSTPLGYVLTIDATVTPRGVDESLIRRQLALTPAQRLAQLESMAREARELSLAGARSRGDLD